MDCLVLNFNKNYETEVIEGKEVCIGTSLMIMSLNGFVSAYTKEVGGDFDHNLNKISSSGYGNRRRRGQKANTFQIKSKRRSTTLIEARLEDEIREQISSQFLNVEAKG